MNGKRILSCLIVGLLVFSNQAVSKEINLSCSFKNDDGDRFSSSVYMNTTTAQASYTFDGDTTAGKLYSDTGTYWFTTKQHSMGSTTKISIDRNTLAFAKTLTQESLGMIINFPGSCEIVQSTSKILANWREMTIK